MNEDVYDVARRETATMACLRCSAVFKQWELDEDDDLVLIDETCPSCGGELERASHER
jgi:rRNA maturation endonuclease Nob1